MDAEDFLNSKDIFNHPRITDRNNTACYDVAELMEEYADMKLAEQSKAFWRMLGKIEKTKVN